MLYHIPRKIKEFPDYLSRGRIREAVDLIKARRGVDPCGSSWGMVGRIERVIGRLQTMKYAEGNWSPEALKVPVELDGQL